MTGWWLLLMIPATLLLQGLVLALSVWADESLLSPRSIIRVAVMRSSPEHVEVLVAREGERLLSP